MLSFVLGLMLMVRPAVAAAQTPVRGGTVVQAIAADPPTMNPGTTTDTQAWTLRGKLFNGLTHLDNDYGSHPDLAEQLAARLGTVCELLSRAFRQLEHGGAVKRSRSRVTIRDPECLAEIARAGAP